MLKRLTFSLVSAALVVAISAPAYAAVAYDQDVTNEIIFGSGNANGGFTTDRDNGIELGLRGKLRHNQAGLPENTFNSNGDGTYTLNAGVAPSQSFPTAVWSFEWSINSDYEGTSNLNLADLTYELAMTSSTGAAIAAFDPIHDLNPGINRLQWDHAIGDNSTPNGGGAFIPNANDDEAGYAALIGGNSLAQNSWKPHWFATNFDPTVNGTYDFRLTAFDSAGAVASTAMQINVVPEPASLALVGLATLGLGLFVRRGRNCA